MKKCHIVILLLAINLMLFACQPDRTLDTDTDMTLRLDDPDAIEHTLGTATDGSRITHTMTSNPTLYTGEVYNLEEGVATQTTSILRDQLHAALDHEGLSWRYRSEDQELIDAQWKERIHALDLEPSTLFTTSPKRMTDLPHPYSDEVLTIIYEGALSAEEGYRMLDDLPEDLKERTRSYALSVMEVSLNDFPVLYICLWISAS